MTVTTTTNSVVYQGNGAATSFAVPFKVIEEDHLVVRRRVYDTGTYEHTYVGTDYSYSGLGSPSGTLTLDGAALEDDYELVIERIVPYTQDLDIVNAGGFYPETVEEQFDLMAMGIQQIAGTVNRAIVGPVGSSEWNITESAEERAGKIIGFDIDGGLTVSTGADFPQFRGPAGSLEVSGLAFVTPQQFMNLDTRVAPTAATIADETVTDDYEAFNAALASIPPTGGTLYIPAGKYYLSQTIEVADNVQIVGEGRGQNAGVVGATSFSFPDYLHGTVIIFAAETRGFVFYGVNKIEDPSVVGGLPNPERYAEYGSTGFVIRDLVLASLQPKASGFTATASAEKDGILIRARGRVERVWVFGFGGHGIWINADAGIVDFGQMFGNANHFTLFDVMVWGNGLDGLHVEGRDANNGHVILLDATANGGWGLYDFTLTGNTYITCHFNTNNVTLQASATANIGSVKTEGASNLSQFINCYGEGAGGYISELTQAVTVDGGNFSGALFHPEDSEAHIRNGGIARHAPWVGETYLGDTGARMFLGSYSVAGALNSPLHYASDDITGLNQGHFSYVTANKAWSWHAGAIANTYMQWPTQESNWRGGVIAPSFPNGIFLGTNAAGPRIFYGAAAPVAGTWALGDMVINSQPAVGEPPLWQCVVAGTPGTWAASPNLV